MIPLRVQLIRTMKEIARHSLHLLGWKRSYAYLREKDRQARFSAIYETGVWRRGDPTVSGSGEGSTLDATQAIRGSLPEALERLGARMLLDVGCGDFTWMREITLPCEYVGIDLVSSVIGTNRDAYESVGRRFLVADAVVDPLPKADVVLCREVLFHLSLDEALSAVRNILSGDRRYLIATTDRATLFNADIETGDFRMLNLERKPFFFPRPLMELSDGAMEAQRVLAIWNVAQLRAKLPVSEPNYSSSGPLR